tara:strand:+ start:642 stop:1235 length:594 start_codon:yes stop_codon:yes gene_type:complete
MPAEPTSTPAVTLPNIDFTKDNYKDLPYLNINADANLEERTIKLEDLFDYQNLSIPDPDKVSVDPDKRYSILNIKKQFICVKFVTGTDEKSRIYVKRPVIDEKTLNDLLPLIKTDKNTIANLTEEIVFSSKNELKDIPENKNTTKGSSTVKQAVDIFEKVYQKIDADKQPYFANGTNTFQGGNKRGGTRKRGGSRSR